MAAGVMLAADWYLIDPILSAGIGILILWSSWKLLRESVDVLMEATPATVDVPSLRQAFQDVDGVADVHDFHVWTVTSGLIAMTAHLEVTGDRAWVEVLNEINRLARERFGIAHVTLQPESPVDRGTSFVAAQSTPSRGGTPA